MSAIAWIQQNWNALSLILLGALLLFAKIPFIEHNPLLEGMLQAMIGGVKKDPAIKSGISDPPKNG